MHPDASVAFAIFGGILVALMLLFASMGILFIIRSSSLYVELVARGGTVPFQFVGVAWIAYQLYIRPWRIQRRVRVALAQSGNAS